MSSVFPCTQLRYSITYGLCSHLQFSSEKSLSRVYIPKSQETIFYYHGLFGYFKCNLKDQFWLWKFLMQVSEKLSERAPNSHQNISKLRNVKFLNLGTLFVTNSIKFKNTFPFLSKINQLCLRLFLLWKMWSKQLVEWNKNKNSLYF